MAPSVGIAAAGLALQVYDRMRKPSASEQQRSSAVTAAEQAQSAEVQRQTELAKFLEGLFKGNLSADGSSYVKTKGSQPGDEEWFGQLQRAAAAKNLMGLTGNPGSGLLGQASQQNYLQDAQGHQDLVSSAEALADSVLAKYGNNAAAEVPETKRVQDLFTSRSIQPIDEPGGNYTLPPNPF